MAMACCGGRQASFDPRSPSLKAPAVKAQPLSSLGALHVESCQLIGQVTTPTRASSLEAEPYSC